MSNLYFDNAATTFPSPESVKEYVRILNKFPGNPSSSHTLGKKSKEFLEKTRESVASSLDLDNKNEIYFTSCATESNNIVLQSLLFLNKKGRVILTNSEHPSISNNQTILKQYGFDVKIAKSKNGIVTLNAIEELLNEDTILVELIYINNILGTKNDILSLGDCIKSYSNKIGKTILFHTDAVQTIGKTEISLNELKKHGVTSASFSGHKFYAPRGTGILFSTSPLIHSLSRSGGQENGTRGGTENLASIGSTAFALKNTIENIKNDINTISKLKNIFLEKLSQTQIKYKILSHLDNSTSVPNILSLSIMGLPGEVCVRALSEKGIFIGTTSACSANAKSEEKNALSVMGYSKDVSTNAIRISFSHDQTEEDIHKCVTALNNVYNEYSTYA